MGRRRMNKYQEEPEKSFGDIVRDLLEYLIEHMYENGVSESQEVSYSENGIEFKLTFEMIEKEAGEDNEL